MSTTTVNVRLRLRRRLPLLKVHGLLAPITAMLNMIIFLMIIMWWFFKYTAMAIYVGGSAAYRAINHRPRARFPRSRQTTDWTLER